MSKRSQEVVDVTQSPMNAKRWLVRLACGHEHWVTRARRPTAKRMPCSNVVCDRPKP